METLPRNGGLHSAVSHTVPHGFSGRSSGTQDECESLSSGTSGTPPGWVDLIVILPNGHQEEVIVEYGSVFQHSFYVHK